MRRRDFIRLTGGAAAASSLLRPLAARAQTMRRVGVLMNGAATEAPLQSYVAAFVQGLRQLGWTEGHVWTAPAVQEESDFSAKRSGAVMYSAFECSRYGRWP